MPGLVTHMLAANIAINKLDSDELRKIIERNINVFFMGAEGPDIFLYYHQLPLQEKKSKIEVKNYSNLIHFSKTNEYFNNLISGIDSINDEVAIAYIAGFMCHNRMDSTCHPYVYYFTEKRKNEDKNAHVIFETIIDLAILERFKLKISEYKPHKRLKLKKNEIERLVRLTSRALEKTYNVKTNANQLKDCYKDIRKSTAFLYDPNGKKMNIFSKIENILGYNGLVTSMTIPVKYDNKLDPMNYREEKWCHPCDENEIHHCNFENLFDETVTEEVKLLNKYGLYLKEKCTIDDVINQIGDYSYTTGKILNKEMYCFKE